MLPAPLPPPHEFTTTTTNTLWFAEYNSLTTKKTTSAQPQQNLADSNFKDDDARSRVT